LVSFQLDEGRVDREWIILITGTYLSILYIVEILKRMELEPSDLNFDET
jgi:hypothetical protein